MHSMPFVNLRRLTTIFFAALLLTGCFGEGDGPVRVLATPAAVVEDEFILVFADEFDVDGAPSSEKWTIRTGYGEAIDGGAGWGNNEWQLYTDSPDNIRVEDGNLVIQARCDTPPCGKRDDSITSGRLNTQGKFDFKFGKVEARIKPPAGKGVWPAFWSLGANFPDVGWPRSGEMDFFEFFPAVSDDRTSHFTVHWCDETIQAPETCSFPEGRLFDGSSRTLAEPLGDDFHIIEAEWNEDRIIGKIDGVQYFSKAIDPATMEEFLREFYLIMNLAMGGTLGSNNQDPDGSEVFPQTMLVDYVRVYQRASDIGGGGGDDNVTVIDFEPDGGPYMFGDFEGGVGFVIPNPEMDDINPSDNVAQMLKFAGGATFAGTTLAAPLDVTANSTFTIKVFSPRAVELTFKLEGATDFETTVNHGGTGWETLTLDLASASGTFTGITFIFDNGIEGDSEGDPDNWTFYIDDITITAPAGSGGGGDGPDVIDFEPDGGPYTFGDFEGGVGFVTANPEIDSINPSANVAQMLKFAGGATFAGTTLSAALDVTAGSTFTMKVFSPRSVEVTFKLEGGAAAETTADHGGTGWETLTFGLPSASGSFTGITFIFDNGIEGDSEGDPDNWTFYIDDITITPPDTGGGDPGEPDANVIDFEPAGGPYVFGDFEGGVGFVTANPEIDAINPSANVAQMLKFAGGALFAGTTLSAALDVTANSTFTMKVFSPRSVEVTFKLEGATDFETTADHGGTGWETLTLNLASASGSFTGITFIFDNGIEGDSEGDPDNWTFYIDDITITAPDTGGGDPGGGGEPDPNVVSNFEDAGGPYAFNDFEGGVGFVDANPDMDGNTSAKVAKILKFAGATFAGTTFKPDGGIEVVTGTSFTMKVWSMREVDVLFKLEGAPDIETTVTHGGTGWETLTFDLTAANGSYSGITFIFDNGTAGDAEGDPDNWTFYIDDITAVPPDGGGGDPGGGGDEPGAVIADFEGPVESYDFGPEGGFGGGAASVVANPDMDGNPSATVGQMLKFNSQVFGGATLFLETPLEIGAGRTFTMKVWSQREVDVLFKLESAVDDDVEVTHGGTGWEELTFFFPEFAGSIDGITLIFDLGELGMAATDPDNWTFYFDDIELVGSGGGGAPVELADFEGPVEDYDFGPEGGFGGGAASVVDNPDMDGNTSAKVGQMLKFNSQVFGGATLFLDPAIDVVAGTSFTIKVWSQREVDVLFKLESTVDVDLELTHGGTGWEDMTFVFTTFAGSVDGITLIFDLGVLGMAATDPVNWTFYFDDITQVPPTGR